MDETNLKQHNIIDIMRSYNLSLIVNGNEPIFQASLFLYKFQLLLIS